MAKRIWTDGLGTGNIQTAGNYADGVAPGNGDEIVLDNYAGHINAGLGWSAGPTNFSLTFGPNWKGRIGTVSGRLELNTSTGRVRVNAPNSGAVYIGNAVWTMGDVEMHVCSLDPGSPFFLYDGEGTRLSVLGPGNLIVGAGYDVAEEMLVGSKYSGGPSAMPTIESGADIEVLRIVAGRVKNYAALKTVKGHGGQLDHLGSASGNTGNISVKAELHTGFYLNWLAGRQAAGFTATLIEMLGGRFSSVDSNMPNTATLIELYDGQVALDPQWTVSTLRKRTVSPTAKYDGPEPAAIQGIIVPPGK